MSMKYLNWMYANIPYKYLMPGEQSVLAALAIRYNDSPGKTDGKPNCYPSMTTLKRMTQLSESGINKIKVSLRRLGFIKWKSGGQAGGHHTSNEYELLYPKVKGATRPIFAEDSLELDSRRHRRPSAESRQEGKRKESQPKPARINARVTEGTESSDEAVLERQMFTLLDENKDTEVGATLQTTFERLAEYGASASQILPILKNILSHAYAHEYCLDAVYRIMDMTGDGADITHPIRYLGKSIHNAIKEYEEDLADEQSEAEQS